MTKPKELRDEFALEVMKVILPEILQAISAGATYVEDGGPSTPQAFLAAEAYAVANAMMAEREKTHDPV